MVRRAPHSHQARHRQRRPGRRLEQGFSLIELMMTLVIGLFVLMGIFVIFQGVRTTYTHQDRMALLQENQRIAVVMLSNTINNAGYHINPMGEQATAVFGSGSIQWANGTSSPMPAGQALVGSGSNAGSDRLAVRFQSANADGLMDCLGRVNKTGGNVVYTNIIELNNSNELTCRVNGASAVTLATGVGRLNILYGVDTDDSGGVDVYLAASAFTNASLWSKVQVVRLNITYLNPLAEPGSSSTFLPTSIVHSISVMGRV